MGKFCLVFLLLLSTLLLSARSQKQDKKVLTFGRNSMRLIGNRLFLRSGDNKTLASFELDERSKGRVAALRKISETELVIQTKRNIIEKLSVQADGIRKNFELQLDSNLLCSRKIDSNLILVTPTQMHIVSEAGDIKQSFGEEGRPFVKKCKITVPVVSKIARISLTSLSSKKIDLILKKVSRGGAFVLAPGVSHADLSKGTAGARARAISFVSEGAAAANSSTNASAATATATATSTFNQTRTEKMKYKVEEPEEPTNHLSTFLIVGGVTFAVMVLVLILCLGKAKSTKCDEGANAVNRATTIRNKRFEQDWRLGGAYPVEEESARADNHSVEYNAKNRDSRPASGRIGEGFVVLQEDK